MNKGKNTELDKLPPYEPKNKVNLEGLKYICQISKTDLHEWISVQMKEYYSEEKAHITPEYIFFEGDIPILLCAHLDVVHKDQPIDFIYNSNTGVITSPTGIGGDDRCGVYAILSILKATGKKPYLFFSTDEETGSKSTEKAASDLVSFKEKINFAIQIDRRGKDDSVYYTCGNKKFKSWIDSFGFKEQTGSRTDICVFINKWDIAAVNLSSGYYNEHKSDEFIKIQYLGFTIDKVCNILNSSEIKKYSAEEKKYNTKATDNYYDDYGYYGYGYKEFYKGDIVKAQYLTVAREELRYVQGNSSVSIPKDTILVISEIDGYSLKVEFMGRFVWVDSYGFKKVKSKNNS